MLVLPNALHALLTSSLLLLVPPPVIPAQVEVALLKEAPLVLVRLVL
jgi:hypothetical protein